MGGFFSFIHITMAIKIEFYQLITPTHIAWKYFPKQYENESCWNDGVICTPMGTMNLFDINSIIRECEKLGLRRFKEENGERIIGDYYIGTQSGLDDTFQYKKSNLIRVYNGVAWNPSCPLGNDIPYKFPCFHAGFYYESRQVWEEAKQALSAFNKILDEHEPKQLSGTEDDLLLKIISGLPSQTPYDSFFHELSRKTMEQEFIEYRKRNNI